MATERSDLVNSRDKAWSTSSSGLSGDVLSRNDARGVLT